MFTAVVRHVKVAAGLAAVLAAVLGLAKLDDATDPGRSITITIAWKQHADRPGTGHIDVMGQIGRGAPFFAESTSENPFIEAGIAFKGEVVRARAWSVDGPFAVFTCVIAGPVKLSRPSTWNGLQVDCSGVVT